MTPVTPDARALRLRRVSLNVGDLAAARTFYETALGFTHHAHAVRDDQALGALFGVAELRAEIDVLRLGTEEIELVAFDPPGRAYPAPRTAADPWFQHLAIVVADMDRAYAHLCEHPGMAAISQGGPQLLPPETGPVTAFKFRDPEGHPLELSFFPEGVGDAKWRSRRGDDLFLGVDHSAISVADVVTSAAFYTDVLGLVPEPGSVNRGPTQARLDGLVDPVVDIATLHAGDGEGPHLELLGYRRPPPRASHAWAEATDLAATRLVFDVQGLDEIVARALGAEVEQPGGSRAALIRDPDGHLLMLQEA